MIIIIRQFGELTLILQWGRCGVQGWMVQVEVGWIWYRLKMRYRCYRHETDMLNKFISAAFSFTFRCCRCILNFKQYLTWEGHFCSQTLQGWKVWSYTRTAKWFLVLTVWYKIVVDNCCCFWGPLFFCFREYRTVDGAGNVEIFESPPLALVHWAHLRVNNWIEF